MIKIIPRLKLRGLVRVGDTSEFQIIKQSSAVETRSFIKDQNILYLKPLTDWNGDNQIRFTPETPGKYLILVEWRSTDGSKGWEEHSLEVVPDIRITHSPKLINIDPTTSFWVPSEWEASLLSGYDKSTIDFLSQIVKPGWTIYDIGASLGLYSIRFSSLVGQQGHVYCLEANPICVYFLRANIELNGVPNCDILPIALLDSRKDTPFTIIYGNSNVGISPKASSYSSKIGQEIIVQGHGLDELINDYNLKNPDLIKIDIEGAEELAIKGMEKTLSRYRPVIFMEVHGLGAAHNTFPLLESIGYRYQVVSENKEEFSSVKDLLKWFPNAVLQVICYPPEKQSKGRFHFFSK